MGHRATDRLEIRRRGIECAVSKALRRERIDIRHKKVNVPFGDGWNPSPLGEEKFINVAMRRYQLGAHTKTDLKVHLIWLPKYRKRVLTGAVAIRTRDVPRQIALEHEIDIITGKVSSDHIHMFVAYRPMQDISKIVQWLKGISSRILLSEFPHLKKQFW